ncbi:hypothetical protein HYD_5640 [Candidatus Hydrogenosomobacter endosymbioticus]|uniref:Uncharacterized protein n=1 Tax=Candidatus Hydrogenosomobacter endosymbioticus TaxID=2558174 RepID=A0ABM7V9G9_9PROT|nr:hypothetical protein HYD_5640 [Candidatus Hydrogenosomobacter endosymbioticus]
MPHHMTKQQKPPKTAPSIQKQPTERTADSKGRYTKKQTKQSENTIAKQSI